MRYTASESGMTTATSTTLLAGLHDGCERAWRRIVERYRPCIVRFAVRIGLDPEDSQDAAQQTLIAFHRSYAAGDYDREKGRLRTWLFAIARNQTVSLIRRRERRCDVHIHQPSDQTDFFARVAEESSWESVWEEEWQDAMLRQCLAEVQGVFDAKTLDLFWRYAYRGEPAEEVAREQNVSVNAVYLARHRVLNRIRTILPQMGEIW